MQPVKKPRLKSKLYMGMLVMVTIPCCIFLILMIFGSYPFCTLDCYAQPG